MAIDLQKLEQKFDALFNDPNFVTDFEQWLEARRSSQHDAKLLVVCRYYHPCVGYGDFVREYNGRYGLGLIIKLDNGREWFAPINEFTRVR